MPCVRYDPINSHMHAKKLKEAFNGESLIFELAVIILAKFSSVNS